MSKPFIKSLKDIPLHRAPKRIAYYKLATDSSISPIEVDYVPVGKGKTIEGHIHQKSNAFCLILECSGVVLLEKETKKITKGDIVNIPAGTWHQFTASEKEGLVFLSVQNPPIGNDYLFS